MSGPAAAPDAVGACCAAAYDDDLVEQVLGPSYHPGGLALTRRLAGRLELRPGARVLDLASGIGTTAVTLAAEFEVDVTGIDLGERSVQRATETAAAAGLADRVRFLRADATGVPCAPGAFDAVVCECAWCTFPDKAAAAAEFARVLAPGGRVGITDVTVRGELPVELAGLAGWIACLADARPAEQYAALLADAGLTVETVETHDAALAAMIDRIDARLRVLAMTRAVDIDIARARELTGLAARAVASGAAGYALLVARKPPGATPGP